MIKKQFFLSIILLPVVLLLAAYLFWPLWAPPLARALTANAGIELVMAEIRRPGWQNMKVDNLQMRYASEGFEAAVEVPQLSLNYSWRSLLDGRLNSLHIPSTVVQLASTKDEVPAVDTDKESVEPLYIAELLPSVLFPKLPASNVHVDQFDLNLPDELHVGALRGSLHFSNGDLQLELASTEAEKKALPVLEFNLRVDQSNHLQLDFQHDGTPVMSANSSINDEKLTGELTVDLTSGAELLKQFKMLVAGDELAGLAKFQWQLPLPETVMDDDWVVEADFQTQLVVDDFKQGDVSADSIKFFSTGQAHLSVEQIRLHINGGHTLEVGRLKTLDARLAKLVAVIPNAFELSLQREKLQIPELELQLPATSVSWQQEAYRFTSAHIKLREFVLNLQNPEQRSSAIELSLSELKVATGDFQINPLNMQGNWLLENDTLAGNVKISDALKVLLVRGDMKHNLSSGAGQLISKLDTLSFQKSQSYLPRLFSNWPYPFDLFAGELEMDSLLTWTASQFDVKSRIKLTNLGGFYDTNLFRGLNAELKITGPLENPTLVVDPLTVNSVDVGLPVKNIYFALKGTKQVVQVNNFHAELLGGQVGQKLVRYDLTRDDNELLVQIQGIELDQLLNLETGVEGLGILDGELPVRISAKGISVSEGEIKARKPGGFIKYQGAKSIGDAVADVGVGFALEALENFHYEVLDAKASYSEDGQLKLATVLEGRNPDMSEKRPVHYNINIQENIPALIESLKLTQQISDDLERRIQAFYKKK